MDSQRTLTIPCSCRKQILFCSSFLAQEVAQKGIAVFEFPATAHTEAFGKSLQQVTGIAHILRESVKPFTWRKVEKVVQPGEGKAFGRPSITFPYQKGLKRVGPQGVMALNWESIGLD